MGFSSRVPPLVPVAPHYWIGACPGASWVAEEASTGLNEDNIETDIVVDHREKGLGPGFKTRLSIAGVQEQRDSKIRTALS
jgi:hypothetical protein